MSCSVCTCTHHLAIHRAKDPMPCQAAGCGCEAFVLLDVIARAGQPGKRGAAQEREDGPCEG